MGRRPSPPEHYSGVFLRRKTINPRNAIASTAQMMRTKLPSIVFLLSRKINPGAYMLFIIGSKSRRMRMTTGPTVTTNSEGNIQKKIGKTSLTPSLAAFSSAIWRA
jgi:hypothetical protein